MKLLLSGLDTIECAYYLHSKSEGGFDFAGLRELREAARESKHPDSAVVTLGDVEFLLSPNGTRSGYPFLLSNQHMSVQFGEFNNPSFFVTYRSLGLLPVLWTPA